MTRDVEYRRIIARFDGRLVDLDRKKLPDNAVSAWRLSFDRLVELSDDTVVTTPTKNLTVEQDIAEVHTRDGQVRRARIRRIDVLDFSRDENRKVASGLARLEVEVPRERATLPVPSAPRLPMDGLPVAAVQPPQPVRPRPAVEPPEPPSHIPLSVVRKEDVGSSFAWRLGGLDAGLPQGCLYKLWPILNLVLGAWLTWGFYSAGSLWKALVMGAVTLLVFSYFRGQAR